MPSKTTLFLTLVLTAGCLWAQDANKPATAPAAPAATATTQTPHQATLTAADKERKNPMKFTTVSADRGKKVYATQCAICHGDKGDGKGELAADMKLHLPDFTTAGTLDARTDGELYAIIGNWKDPMPPQTGRMSEMQRWNLVNYLREVSGKTPAKSTGDEPDENILLVPQGPAPDATPTTKSKSKTK